MSHFLGHDGFASLRSARESWRGVFGRRSARRRLARGPQLQAAESLERRQPLAADLGIDGVLTITGSEKADKIMVSAGPDNGSVILRGVPGVAKNAVFSGVNGIVVNSLGGNDDIRIGSAIRDTAGNLIGVTVNTGFGNDKVEGGDGDDDIDGGAGNDRLRGRGGDDTIRGGIGNDGIDGEDGDDTCYGDAGKDTIRGGDDDDSLSGGTDKDKLFGDAGDDSLDGDEGDDRLIGGRGNDDDYDDDRDDDLDDFEDEDKGENEGGDDDWQDAVPITFTGNSAQVSGSSVGKQDKKYYVFTAPATGVLTVALQPGTDGRYADLELEREGVEDELLELEPSDDDNDDNEDSDDNGPTSGTVNVTQGLEYRLRLRAPDLDPVSYTVLLTLAPVI